MIHTVPAGAPGVVDGLFMGGLPLAGAGVPIGHISKFSRDTTRTRWRWAYQFSSVQLGVLRLSTIVPGTWCSPFGRKFGRRADSTPRNTCFPRNVLLSRVRLDILCSNQFSRTQKHKSKQLKRKFSPKFSPRTFTSLHVLVGCLMI